MGFNNGYDSGYADALEDVRNGRVAGLGSAAATDGAARQRYSVVRVAGGDPNGGLDLSDEDVLSVTMEDLGVDSTSSEPQTMDFDQIADKLAPVVMLGIVWSVSTGSIYVQGPEGYDWQYLANAVSPGSSTRVVLAVSGNYYVET